LYGIVGDNLKKTLMTEINKYSPKWNRACHVWRVTFFLNSPTICNKYQINNIVMFNNLSCRFWQVINLVKKDQNSLKSCVELFFLNFVFNTSFLSTEKLSIQSRPRIILSRSISRLNEILFHYK
jgi:hypothetical protein